MPACCTFLSDYLGRNGTLVGNIDAISFLHVLWLY